MGRDGQSDRRDRRSTINPYEERRAAGKKGAAAKIVKAEIITPKQKTEAYHLAAKERRAAQRQSIDDIYRRMLALRNPAINKAEQQTVRYSDAIAEAVLEKVRSGWHLAKIYESDNELPHPSIFRKWMETKPELAEKYNRAIEESTEILRTFLLENGLSDDNLHLPSGTSSHSLFNVGEMARRRLVEDHLKREIKWRHPTRYGRRAIEEAAPEEKPGAGRQLIGGVKPDANIKKQDPDGE